MSESLQWPGYGLDDLETVFRFPAGASVFRALKLVRDSTQSLPGYEAEH